MPFQINMLEIIGYCGSVLIAVSLMMNSIKHLRWVNIFGASTFAVYGLMVKAYPVFFLNSFITIVDFYYLLQINRRKDFFELFQIKLPESPYLKRFLEFYKDDIARFFPDFKGLQKKDDHVIFIMRNLSPVGLFIAQRVQKSTLEIKLDYVIPNYRDLRSAHFLYQQSKKDFRLLEINRFIVHSKVNAHIKYLKKIGFTEDNDRGTGWFKKDI